MKLSSVLNPQSSIIGKKNQLFYSKKLDLRHFYHECREKHNICGLNQSFIRPFFVLIDIPPLIKDFTVVGFIKLPLTIMMAKTMLLKQFFLLHGSDLSCQQCMMPGPILFVCFPSG